MVWAHITENWDQLLFNVLKGYKFKELREEIDKDLN